MTAGGRKGYAPSRKNFPAGDARRACYSVGVNRSVPPAVAGGRSRHQDPPAAAGGTDLKSRGSAVRFRRPYVARSGAAGCLRDEKFFDGRSSRKDILSPARRKNFPARSTTHPRRARITRATSGVPREGFDRRIDCLPKMLVARLFCSTTSSADFVSLSKAAATGEEGGATVTGLSPRIEARR
jgi:hypothetical protein